MFKIRRGIARVNLFNIDITLSLLFGLVIVLILARANRSTTTLQVTEELIKLAQEMKQTANSGQELELTEEELTFYKALETNDRAIAVLSNNLLKQIAQELTQTKSETSARQYLNWLAQPLLLNILCHQILLLHSQH